MVWSGKRRAELPANWSALRLKVKARANGQCQAAVHEPGCDGIGTDCDHIRDRHDHSMSNLQWLSGPCHKAKTQRESIAAQPAVRQKRTPRRHPSDI